MPDALSALFRLSAVQWNGLPIAYLAVFAIGGLMYVAMSMSTRSSPNSARALAAGRPGWIARRRARAGIAHRRDRVGVGYKSAVGAVHLTLAELAGHGLAVGGPKSGKTTFLQLLVEASVGRLPVVVLDPKGSPALADTVRAHGGQVWTLDGKLPADLLDPRPWQVPDLLLEAEVLIRALEPHRGRDLCVSANANARFESAELTWQPPGCGSGGRGCGGGPVWLAASLALVEPCQWRRTSALLP